MKKSLLALCLLITLACTHVFAGGGTTHMLLAKEAIALLPNQELRQLLLKHMDAYLVGAYYPDSGYVEGTGYGEDSHWDPFIHTFADYIKTAYPDFRKQNPDLVAFLFGCAAHRVSDEVTHWTFYREIADHDFAGDRQKAHDNADLGIDLFLIHDKAHSLSQPSHWWVPVDDLLAVYHLMGKDQYTAREINWGNAVISTVGNGERIIAPASYPIYQGRMPWAAAHYYDWAIGGMQIDELQIAQYQTALWQRLITR
jgi:hypothetical protein